MSTHNIPFSIQKSSPKIIQNFNYRIFSKGLKFEIAVVNEPSVFEPLNFCCIFWGHSESSGVLGLITVSFPVF